MRDIPVKLALIPLSMLFVVPFVVWNHQPPLMSFYAECCAAALILLVFLASMTVPARWDVSLPGYVLFGLAGLIVLQVALGRVAELSQAVIAITYLLCGVALIYAVRILISRLGSSALVVASVWGLIIGGGLNTLFAIQQTWSISTLLNDVVVVGRAGAGYGNLAQTNHLASYLGIGLASVLYLLATNRIRLILAVGIGAWLVFGLSLSASRSAWLFLFALLALGGVWFYKQRTMSSVRVAALACLYLILFACLQWTLAESAGLMTASQRLVSEGRGLDIRLVYWRHAFQMFIDNPLFGVGYQNFAWANFELVAVDVAQGVALPAALHSTAVNNAHNVIMQLLAEFGVPGVLVTGVFLFWISQQLKKKWTPERWWGWAILFILGVHSMLEFPLWYAYFGAVFAVVLGLLQGDLPSQSGLNQRKGLLFLMAVLAAGLVILLSLGTKYPLLERVYSYGPTRNPGYTSVQLQADLRSLQDSWLLYPWVAFAYTASPVEPGRVSSWPLQLQINSVVVKRWPNSGPLYRQILLLALTGNSQAAEELLNSVARVHPDMLGGFLAQVETFATVSPGANILQKRLRSMMRAVN